MSSSWVVCALAAASVGAALLGARRASFAREEVVASVLPRWLDLALPWAQALAKSSRWKVPARVSRLLMRQLARAGVLDALDARVWVAALGCIGVLALLLGALLWAWFEVPPLAVVALPTLAVARAQAWLARRARSRTAELERELPSAIDLLVLCLESGASLGTAIRIGHDKSARGAIRDLFAWLLREIRSGQDRAAAFCSVRDRLEVPAVSGLLTALIQADSRGMSLGPALRAQSVQCIADRFVRAERAAMQAPVRLLFPLLVFIFPCTFIVIAVPIAARLISGGGP